MCAIYIRTSVMLRKIQHSRNLWRESDLKPLKAELSRTDALETASIGALPESGTKV